MQGIKDEELMIRYRQGEGAAMDELIRRYKNPLYRFSLRLCTNACEAEEITQEVFLKVHENRNTYRPLGKFSTWIFSIAHNAAVDRLRRRKWWAIWPRKSDNPDEPVEFSSPDPSVQEVAAQNEMSQVVRKVIQGLPFLQKEALVLREFEGLEYEEIAKIMKKSLGTVKTLIFRARQNLKIKLLPVVAEVKGGKL